MGGDTRVKEVDQAREQPEDSGSRLRDDAYNNMGRVSDKAEASGTGAQKKFDNPFDHAGLAGIALRELEALKDKKPTDKITVQYGEGQIKEVTVGERRAELIKAADTEFNKGIEAADRIEQTKVTSTLWDNRTKQSNAADLAELENLQALENVLESMRHAPSALRAAYAELLAGQGQLVKAQEYMKEAAAKDKEAGNNPAFQEIAQGFDKDLRRAQNDITLEDNPFVTIAAADEKRKAGDVAGAEAEYKRAIVQAGKLDSKLISDRLSEIENAKKSSAGDPEALKKLEEAEQAWSSLAHAPALARLNYADFLLEQKRYKDALPELMQVAQHDPELVKGKQDFAQMVEAARNEGKAKAAFDNPFGHIEKFQKLYADGDIEGARKELEASVKASATVDREQMKENKRLLDEELKYKEDPEKRKLRAAFDTLEHAEAFAKMTLARFEIADKKYSSAEKLIGEVEKSDPEFITRPELKWSELKASSKEPSTWEKVKGYTTSIMKELVCDAVAIAAGVGAAVLTGWSGPAAVGVGAVAGAGAYTAMKALMGEEIHWYTPLWGALDGASGGAAAIARTALVKTAGGIVTKEAAAATVAKAGGSVAALEGLEGMKMAQTAQVLAKDGLKTMGKDIGLWSRVSSSVPLIGTGNAEYRAAVSAYRGLKYTNLATRVGVDMGTAGTMSLVYRGGHEGYNYASGKHESFGDFAKAYGMGVVGDSVTGAAMGGLGRWVGEGASSLASRIPGSQYVVGRLPNAGPALDSMWTTSSPKWYESYSARDYLKKTVEPTLAYLQTPVKNNAELRSRYYNVPGTEYFPAESAESPEADPEEEDKNKK